MLITPLRARGIHEANKHCKLSVTGLQRFSLRVLSHTVRLAGVSVRAYRMVWQPRSPIAGAWFPHEHEVEINFAAINKLSDIAFILGHEVGHAKQSQHRETFFGLWKEYNLAVNRGEDSWETPLERQADVHGFRTVNSFRYRCRVVNPKVDSIYDDKREFWREGT